VILAELHPLAAVPWLPIGAYGERADTMSAAVSVFVESFCRSGLACLGAIVDDDLLLGCIYREFPVFAPSLQWFACVAAQQAYQLFDSASASYIAFAEAYQNATCDTLMDLDLPAPPAAAHCAGWSVDELKCPGSSDGFTLCNAANDCSDRYDERNCSPHTATFACISGASVAWSSVCDGADDCMDGSDEYGCTPSP
jgi:hypothetical protein